MSSSQDPFLDIAIRHLPGGLILVDLAGRLRAMNEAGATILGLLAPASPGTPCDLALSAHPKIVKLLDETRKELKAENRQEMTTVKPDGEKIVLGYGTLILENEEGKPVGVGMTFQDITRLIPLMDSHRFLDVALKNLPGGLVFVDLQGKVRGVNQMAQRILALPAEVEPGLDCHKVFENHPQVVKVLLSTCHTLNAVNRQELTTRNAQGGKITLGYGTLILRNEKGQPVGVGLTFQDITRYIPLPLQAEFIRLIDRFFTPFAATLVLAALFLGYAEPHEKRVAVSMVAGLVLFNELSVWIARKKMSWTKAISYTRLVTNFSANVALVYLLGTFWGPMWLLFVLTPVATAMHAEWKKTFTISLISAGALLGIYYSRGLEGAVGWGQASLHAAFIVFISLFVNSVARMVMQIKSAGPVPKTVVPPIVKPTQTPASQRKLAA